jgi:branched-chain amino acid transport system ATP-binding protein
MHFKGKDITHLPSHEIAQMGIGLVPQGRRIFPSLTVKENLTMAAKIARKNDRWSLERVYTHFPILKERSNIKGDLLSGGEQQMLALARALMTNPDLLLLDEPSEGLAPLIVQEIGRIIAQLKEGRYSILLVEQNYHMAMSVADHAYIISKGKIVYQSPVEALKQNEEVKVKYLSATE